MRILREVWGDVPVEGTRLTIDAYVLADLENDSCEALVENDEGPTEKVKPPEEQKPSGEHPFCPLADTKRCRSQKVSHEANAFSKNYRNKICDRSTL